MTGRSPLVVKVDIEFWTYVRYSYTAFFKKTAWFVLLVIVAVISFNRLTQANSVSNNITFAVTSFITVSLLLMAFLFRLIRKDWKSSPEQFKDSKYSFSDNEVAVKRGPLDTALSWDTIRKAEESAGFLVIYPKQIRAFLLPLNCFTQLGELAELKELLREKLGDKAKLKR